MLHLFLSCGCCDPCRAGCECLVCVLIVPRGHGSSGADLEPTAQSQYPGHLHQIPRPQERNRRILESRVWVRRTRDGGRFVWGLKSEGRYGLAKDPPA